MSVVIPTKQRRPLSPWELPSLLTPVHALRRPVKRCRKERMHFAAILAFLHRNRFAVTSQIQRRFGNVLRSARTTRRHLAEMESLGLVGVLPARGVGPLFPKVYFVTGRGIRRVKEKLAERGNSWSASRTDRRGRDSNEGYAAEHVIHELLITEFMLTVWQTIERRPDLELLTAQRRSLAKHPAFALVIGSRKTRVTPDAMFLFRHNSESMCCCFLELDNGTMNTKQMRTKFTRYAVWSGSAPGQQYLKNLYQHYGAKEPRAMFRLLVVARSRTGLDDDGRSAKLRAAADRLPLPVRQRIWLTTVTALRQHQHDERPLDAKVWVRSGDLHGPKESVKDREQTTSGTRHCLFPAGEPGPTAPNEADSS